MKFILEKEGCLAGKQRQGYPACYYINGAVYVFKAKAFYEIGSRFAGTVIPYLMRQIDSINVDSQDDLMIADSLIRNRVLEKGGKGEK